MGAGGEDQGAHREHGNTRQEDDDEDKEHCHTRGGYTQGHILWLAGDDPGDLLEPDGWLGPVDSHGVEAGQEVLVDYDSCLMFILRK